jgi:phosphoribosyl 1,2-cyclic phosphodiesterase
MRITILASGSGGNATLIESGRTRILVDAGLRVRALRRRLEAVGVSPGSIDAILLTHEHSDHLLGAREFSEKYGTAIRATRGTAAAAGIEADLFHPFVPVDAGRDFRIGDLCVRTCAIPHDANEPVAYSLEDGGARCVLASDLGRVEPPFVEFLRYAAALLLEFNHDEEMLREGSYPWVLKRRIAGGFGHLGNSESARALEAAAGPQLVRVVAIHRSQQNNTEDLVRLAMARALGRAGCGALADVATQESGYPSFAL